jgi:molybdopterin/thiamine biosynthesis adenylyltransferase
MKNRIYYKATIDQNLYKQRVNRTEVFLGRTKTEQKEAQKILSESTIGIAGTGGIGGAVALRLARFGVKKIKIADPDKFDWTNINRQLGATKRNKGRNKAEVVGEIVNDLAGDIEIDIFTDGITEDNADEFVQGCDIVLDQIDFSIITQRYALHQAFRRNKNIKHILSCSVVGWAAHLYKFEHNSMPIEEWYKLNDKSVDSINTPKSTDKLVKLFAPRFPHFPPYKDVLRWMNENNGAVPIFAGAPPLAEGMLVSRTILGLLEREYEPYAKWLPPIPQMYYYDPATLIGEFITSDGTFKNDLSLERTWKMFDKNKEEK